MNVERCRSCGQPVVWAVSSTTGRPAPIDAEPAGPAGGNVELVELDDGRVEYRVHHGATEPAYRRSHFATCQTADRWRNRS